MAIKTTLRKSLIDMTGYWFYKHSDLPPGCDFVSDIKDKIHLPLNVIFDVGANVGQTAIRFNIYFPDAKIYSFEPVTETFHLLKKNTERINNVNCYQLALGGKDGKAGMQIFTGSDSVLNSLNPASMNVKGTKETITVNTGDTFCRQNHIDEIDLLKIDTEGYEIQVLKGFSKMLKTSKIKALYCETGFNPENKRNTFINELMNFTSQMGFRFFGMYDIINTFIKGGNNYGNILFVNKEVL